MNTHKDDVDSSSTMNSEDKSNKITSKDADETRISIKDAAAMMGVSVDTLRRWDKTGRLHPAGRSVSGWRYYFLTDIRKLLSDLYQGGIGASDADMSIAYHLPQRSRQLSQSQCRQIKARAEEIVRLTEEGNYIRISLLLADMNRIMEEK